MLLTRGRDGWKLGVRVRAVPGAEPSRAGENGHGENGEGLADGERTNGGIC